MGINWTKEVLLYDNKNNRLDNVEAEKILNGLEEEMYEFSTYYDKNQLIYGGWNSKGDLDVHLAEYISKDYPNIVFKYLTCCSEDFSFEKPRIHMYTVINGESYKSGAVLSWYDVAGIPKFIEKSSMANCEHSYELSIVDHKNDKVTIRCYKCGYVSDYEKS